MNLIFPSFSCPHPHFYHLSGWGCCGHRADNGLVLYRASCRDLSWAGSPMPKIIVPSLYSDWQESIYARATTRCRTHLFCVVASAFAVLHKLVYRPNPIPYRRFPRPDLPRGFAVRLSVPRVVVMQGPPGDDRILCSQPFRSSFCGYVPIRPCRAAR